MSTTTPASLSNPMLAPLGDIANPLPITNQVISGSPITAATVPLAATPSATSGTAALPNTASSGQSTTAPTTPKTSNSATPAKPTAYQSGVQISDSQNSTMYGLTPDETYDSNAGDVTSVSQTLLNNPRAVLVADQFYMSVFGVGAAYPQDVYNFTDGTVNPVTRNAGTWSYASTGGHYSSSTSNSSTAQTTAAPVTQPANGGNSNLNLTAMGSMALVARQIESKDSIAAKFGIKFIDMTPANYNGTQQQYVNQILSNQSLLEPGASPFLDYQELPDFINNVVPNSNSGVIVKPIN